MATIDRCRSILAETERSLALVKQAEIDALEQALLGSGSIAVYGLGREGLAMRAFAMRLMHVGLPVAVVGDMTTPPIGPGDLFLVSCGPGYLSTVEALAGVARGVGTTVAMITSQPNAPLPRQADLLLTIPAQTMAEDEHSSSEQAMGSAFEQAMWVLFDAMVPELQAATGQTVEDLRGRHTNLE
jgi:6-phospho-3-hexuloisomerase